MDKNLLIIIVAFIVTAAITLIILEVSTGMISRAWSSVMYTVMESFSGMLA